MAGLLSLIPSSLKRKIKLKLGAPHLYWSIDNLKRNGFKPKVIADVGAYAGEFSTEVLKTFPESVFYMFEANPEKEAGLKNVVDRHAGKMKLFMSCLGSKPGEEVTFHLMETASSVLDEHFDKHMPSVTLKTETLDNIFTRENIVKVDMVKLDVQGYELEILKGFTKYLPSVDVVISEVSLLDIHKGVPLLREVVNFMFEYGFVAYDICSVSARRPLDQALWQTDLIFVKEDSIFRQDKRYA